MSGHRTRSSMETSCCTEEDEEEDYEDEDEEKPRVGARPQRLVNIKEKIKPIPEPSSLFIFRSTNPYESTFYRSAATVALFYLLPGRVENMVVFCIAVLYVFCPPCSYKAEEKFSINTEKLVSSGSRLPLQADSLDYRLMFVRHKRLCSAGATVTRR